MPCVPAALELLWLLLGGGASLLFSACVHAPDVWAVQDPLSRPSACAIILSSSQSILLPPISPFSFLQPWPTLCLS